MLIFLNQKLQRNVVALIGLAMVLLEICSVCVEGALDFRNLNLIDATSASATASNEYSNQVDNEVFAATDAAPATIKFKDENNLNEDKILKPEMVALYLNVSEYPGEKCNRICVNGQQRVCYFEFTLEHYQAMGV